MDGFLLLATVFLIAGIAAVPVASRLGLGSVLGFLIAGIAIGPVLRIEALGVDVEGIQHFAEFGVVMMLFIVGLELEPKLLWQMKGRLIGLGGLQVGLTAAAVTGAAMLLDQSWTIALAIGLILALSSTAIVLQTLNEKGLMKCDGGQASFSVLLFQDIAVIPMLALIPLLALPDLVALGAPVEQGAHGDGGGEPGHGMSLNLAEDLPGWLRALVTVAAIALVVIGGSVATGPIFRFVSAANLRELFTATALMIVVSIALLMTLVGLSPALGAFLAGVVLANSAYRHELESDLAPFKGLLLGLFFMTVGAGIDFDLLFGSLGTVLGLVLGLILLKAVILYGLGFVFRVPGSDRWLFALGLAQAGEFGFVLLSFTVDNHVIPTATADLLLLVVAISMLLTPVLFILFDRLIAPRFAAAQSSPADEIDETGPIIIAGHGRFGGIVNRMLLANGYKTVVLDHNSRTLEILRTFQFKVFFGDATRPDLLHAAGIENARILVVAIDDREQTTRVVQYVARNHPNIHIVARARDRDHVYDLYSAGAQDIIRETFDSATRAGRSVLEALGLHPFDAQQRVRTFEHNDRAAIRALAEVYDPSIPTHQNRAYVERAIAIRAQQAAEMRGDRSGYGSRIDRGWSPPSPDDVQAVVEAAEAENRTGEEK